MSHAPADDATVANAGPGPASVLVAVAASAGGVPALQWLLAGLPADLPAAVTVVLHRSGSHSDVLVNILQRATRLPVTAATEGLPLLRGTVYVAPPHLHLTVADDGTASLVDGRRIRHVRSSANPLFESAARVFGPNAVAVVLTGGGRDGTDGVQSIAASGGTVIVQDPSTAHAPFMPLSAVETGAVHAVLPLEAIAPAIVDRVRRLAPGA